MQYPSLLLLPLSLFFSMTLVCANLTFCNCTLLCVLSSVSFVVQLSVFYIVSVSLFIVLLGFAKAYHQCVAPIARSGSTEPYKVGNQTEGANHNQTLMKANRGMQLICCRLSVIFKSTSKPPSIQSFPHCQDSPIFDGTP